MDPGLIKVRVVREAELDADSADLTVVIEGSSLFSGKEAFSKARELRALVESLGRQGIEENRVKLRSVAVNSQSFALIKTSSAKYVVSIKPVTLEQLPGALGAIASQKGAKLSQLSWNYSRLSETRSQLRREALAEALGQAQLDAQVLGVSILGLHQVCEEIRNQGYNPEYIAASGQAVHALADYDEDTEIGLHLGNSTTVTMDLRAEFRVTMFATADQADVDKG